MGSKQPRAPTSAPGLAEPGQEVPVRIAEFGYNQDRLADCGTLSHSNANLAGLKDEVRSQLAGLQDDLQGGLADFEGAASVEETPSWDERLARTVYEAAINGGVAAVAAGTVAAAGGAPALGVLGAAALSGVISSVVRDQVASRAQEVVAGGPDRWLARWRLEGAEAIRQAVRAARTNVNSHGDEDEASLCDTLEWLAKARSRARAAQAAACVREWMRYRGQTASPDEQRRGAGGAGHAHVLHLEVDLQDPFDRVRPVSATMPGLTDELRRLVMTATLRTLDLPVRITGPHGLRVDVLPDGKAFAQDCGLMGRAFLYAVATGDRRAWDGQDHRMARDLPLVRVAAGANHLLERDLGWLTVGELPFAGGLAPASGDGSPTPLIDHPRDLREPRPEVSWPNPPGW